MEQLHPACKLILNSGKFHLQHSFYMYFEMNEKKFTCYRQVRTFVGEQYCSLHCTAVYMVHVIINMPMTYHNFKPLILCCASWNYPATTTAQTRVTVRIKVSYTHFLNVDTCAFQFIFERLFEWPATNSSRVLGRILQGCLGLRWWNFELKFGQRCMECNISYIATTAVVSPQDTSH